MSPAPGDAHGEMESAQPRNAGRFAKGNQANFKHGADAATGVLTPDIEERAGKAFDLLLADLGGADVSAARLLLLDQFEVVYTMRLLFQQYLSEKGPMTPRGRVRAVVDRLERYMAREERLLRLLGLDRVNVKEDEDNE